MVCKRFRHAESCGGNSGGVLLLGVDGGKKILGVVEHVQPTPSTAIGHLRRTARRGDVCCLGPAFEFVRYVSVFSAGRTLPQQPSGCGPLRIGARQRMAARAGPSQRAINQRIVAEEQALEYGPADPVRDHMQSLVSRVLPAGVRLLGVGPYNDGWHVSIDADSDGPADALLQARRAMPGLQDVREAPLYPARNPDGSRHLVVCLRLATKR